MPWKGVSVSEQRQRFIEDYLLNFYTISELAERFSISRTTAHKWINRYKQFGQEGYQELSRRPHTCPWQTDQAIVEKLVQLREKHPRWGPRKLLNLLQRRHPRIELPSEATAWRILARHDLVKPRRRHRRAHPGCPKTVARGPNDIWAADYKGQFRLKSGDYCFPLTVSDLASRFILGVDAHETVSHVKTRAHFETIFREFGLPNRIRTDNGVPFASSALARLSKLSVWFIRLGIIPELIEPGKPQQNGIHERMHRTLKQEATFPPSASFPAQQRRFERFRDEFNEVRPHEALGMQRPAEVYQSSIRSFPEKIEPFDYPAHYIVRKVSGSGTIRIANRQFFVSNTLRGDYVGAEEVADGIYDLFFRFYQIGRYKLRVNKVYGIVSKVAVTREWPHHPTQL
ncbi:MAG: IS481 family transposase [Anaerolineales bacterium]|jgi:transposase InsO family protein